MSDDILSRVSAVIESRKGADPSTSYVAKLFDKGLDAILKKVGEEATETVMAAKDGDPKKVVLAVYFRHPYVLDEESGLRRAGALVATFGVSDRALMDVFTGRAKPQGKLPFALAGNLEAVIRNAPDAPGYPAADTLYPFGYGLTY